MTVTGDKLFALLPALYRLRDAQLAASQPLLDAADTLQLETLLAKPQPLSLADQASLDALQAKAARGPLQSLVSVVAEQIDVISQNLGQLYADQFIETCAPWVIPYIGDLIGYQSSSVGTAITTLSSPRAAVANTISFRRRKGTILVLEQLARDTTGWGAHAVEFFKLLADTQYMNHPRLSRLDTPNLRHWRPRQYADTGFDTSAHTVDVRLVGNFGRYNIPNIGLFLWSVNAYQMTQVPATPSPGNPRLWRISPLGADCILYNKPISQGADITSLAKPMNVPFRLARRVLFTDIQSIQGGAPAVYYGPGNAQSLQIYLTSAGKAPVAIPATRVVVCNLSDKAANTDSGGWANVDPTATILPEPTVLVDPELGRIALSQPLTAGQSLVTSYCYGFSAEMGGGPYPRSSSFPANTEQTVCTVSQDPASGADVASITAALAVLAGNGRVEILDSAIYAETPAIAVSASCAIEIRAADGCRPTLLLGGELVVVGQANGACTLNGLLIACTVGPGNPKPSALVRVPATLPSSTTANQLLSLSVIHCTLVPGWALSGTAVPLHGDQPSIAVEQNGVQLTLQQSISGPLHIASEAVATCTDSIIDALAADATAYVAALAASGVPSAGGALSLVRCTVIGKVYATVLTLVSDSVVWAHLGSGDQSTTPPHWRAGLWAVRTQQGCVRFSYIPTLAVLPRAYQCVSAGTGTGPLFRSLAYGDPGYAQIMSQTDDSVRRGADNGGEMGAFNALLSPLREDDLRQRVIDYCPVGLSCGIFYET